MRIVFWGTYDTGKPRTRLLLAGLHENGVEVIECHKDIWTAIEDKSQIKGKLSKIWIGLRWLVSYPGLLWRYMRLPKHDAVLVGYMGQLDVLVLWPFARLRKTPIIWDAFLSLYNTIIEDRQLVEKKGLVARSIHAWEWMSTRAADRIILDTKAHSQYFIDRFGVPPKKSGHVWVGAEAEHFPLMKPKTAHRQDGQSQEITVLFYGQFIPLHGIETIIQAAQLAPANSKPSLKWVIIGQGQEENAIRQLLEHSPVDKLEWHPWVPYQELRQWIARADICLGVFGDSDKAARVIPNKVFQIVMSGKPLITRDSPAIRELFPKETVGLRLVPPEDPQALLAALNKTILKTQELQRPHLYGQQRKQLTTKAIGTQLLSEIHTMLKQTRNPKTKVD